MHQAKHRFINPISEAGTVADDAAARAAARAIDAVVGTDPPLPAPGVMLAWLHLSAPVRTFSGLVLLLATATLLMPLVSGGELLSASVAWPLLACAGLGVVQLYCALRVQFGADLAGALLHEPEPDDAAITVDAMLNQLGVTARPPAPPTMAARWPGLRRWLRLQMTCAAVQMGVLLLALWQAVQLAV
ncbi:MAG: hypothetical protein ABW178_10470 [Pseudoxanthomonas sp.]